MLTKTFFKLFPPPKFLNIPYAGLDISDDAVRCIEYVSARHGYAVHRYGSVPLQVGVIDSGNIKNESELSKAISLLAKKLKISAVKVSLPEERMYLFKTEIHSTNEDQIRQNIEFKLEENVPLSPLDSIFFFDIIPKSDNDNKSYASVSVAPRELVNSYLKVIQSIGLHVISFEIQAKAIARALVPIDSLTTQLIINIMEKKTGIYIVYGGVVCFTSTIAWGKNGDVSILNLELQKIFNYWKERGEGKMIEKIIISGSDAVRVGQDSHIGANGKIPLEIGKIWQNAFSNDDYVPPITFEESLDYAVASGLALP